MKKLLFALVFILSLQSFDLIAAPLQTVNIKNSSSCTIQFVVYAADFGICAPMYQSVVYTLPPGGGLVLTASTIAWVTPPPNPLYSFISADITDDGYGICPNGMLPTACPGGNNDICNIGDGSCGYLSSSCFIIGNICSTCNPGITINAGCSFAFPLMSIAVW